MSEEVQVRVGDWVLFNRDRSYYQISVEMKQAESVTPKLVKFAGGYPRQTNRLSVVAAFADRETAERVRNGIAGVAGEFSRRRRLAQDELAARVSTALEAANKQVARLVADARHD